MTLRQIFILNLKNFRKKEGLSQMELAECCNSSPGYIGEIEIGRKFPSIEMIEKIAKILKIEPHFLFKNHTESSGISDAEKAYPALSNAMKNEIKSQINSSVNEIFDKY